VDGQEQFEYDDRFEPGELLDPRRVNLNLEDIEMRRSKLESRRFTTPEDADLDYDNHTERRRREIARFEGSRPNTLALSFIKSAEGVELQDRWGDMRTEQGLFIAARESSWDWLTSYDCLDKVRTIDYPRILPISAVRDEPPSDDDDDDDDDNDDGEDSMIRRRNYDPDLDQDLPDDVPLRQVVGINPPFPERKASRGKKRKSDDVNEGSGKVKKNKTQHVPKAPATADGSGQKETPATVAGSNEIRNAAEPQPAEIVDDLSWMRRRANIDYPYLKHEFHLLKRERPADGEDALSITPWIEETEGRREWHVYRRLSPSSEVYSPPRSPLRPDDVAADSLPKAGDGINARDVWHVIAADEVPATMESKRRCKRSEKCQAWWPHPAEECWIVHSEEEWRPPAPALGTPTPPERITEELKPLETPFTMTESSLSTYRARLYDHYGIRQPRDQDAQWPNLGIRVPYEPTTFDDMKPPVEEDVAMDSPGAIEEIPAAVSDESTPDNTKGRGTGESIPNAYGFYSMTVPIIKQPHKD
jgi:hypothetical protein